MSIITKNEKIEELNNQFTQSLKEVQKVKTKIGTINSQIKMLKQIYTAKTANSNEGQINSCITVINNNMREIIPGIATISSFRVVSKLNIWASGEAGTEKGYNHTQYTKKVQQIDTALINFKTSYLLMRNNTKTSMETVKTKLANVISDLEDSYKKLNNAVVETTSNENLAADLQKKIETTSKNLSKFLKSLDTYIEDLDAMPDKIDLIMG